MKKVKVAYADLTAIVCPHCEGKITCTGAIPGEFYCRQCYKTFYIPKKIKHIRWRE